MREVNFSIPNVNKASVHITTTLYDRRALDCTSTLPLINSLNHLAYLTTSSARIRDILTVDGGVERLICILKNGRNNRDVMDLWKWNLAFQCVVNIGVRGSESVRTRVVEADMVPVIATILDNYIRAVERMKAKADADQARQGGSRHGSNGKQPSKIRDSNNRSSFFERSNGNPENRQSRRQAPPPSIEIPHSSSHQHSAEPSAMDITPTQPAAMSSPPDRTAFLRPQPHHHHHRSQDSRPSSSSHRPGSMQSLATPTSTMDATDGFNVNLRPVREIDRLPSMVPSLHTGILSQPESPTTPSVPHPRDGSSSALRRPRRPSIRQLHSTSADPEDANNAEDSAGSEEAIPVEVNAPIVEVQAGIPVQTMEDREVIMETDSTPLALQNQSDNQPETFNITHRSPVDGTILTATAAPAPQSLSPAAPNPNNNFTSPVPSQAYPSFTRTLPAAPGIIAAMPRDEDVLMSLQLLAYVSKYCNLRSYFQQTHLVPMLKIDRDLSALDNGTEVDTSIPEGDEWEEYLQPDDFNIFPLVEKFTVRHHSKDMQYWACVVMRNLCRKDDSRGGIRQCAYYKCGKWEEFTRQFAKCRRCRRTKYCSKECQKEAWVYHRHWCYAPSPS